MARSRRGPRTRLDKGERRALSALKAAGVYKPKGTPSPRALHRKLRKPGMAEIAAKRPGYKALKVGQKAAREFKTLPTARDRVIIRERPGVRVYARKGEVYEAEADLRGRPVPGGMKRRVAKEVYAGGPPPRPIGRRARGAQGFVITVNGYPSGIFFASFEQAQAYARNYYPRAQTAARADPAAMVVSIDAMTRGEWDTIMEERESQRAAKARERDRRRRERRRLARSVRPF